MTQKKSIASKLLLAAIALTLISFCFLGSTFARYTSSNGGQASLNVAKWDVSMGEGSISVDFEKLSPSAAEYPDAGADAAQRVDGHAEEVGHIAQLDTVGQAVEAGEELAVALGGRQLEAVLPRPRGVMAVSRRPRPTCAFRRAASLQTSHGCHGG